MEKLIMKKTIYNGGTYIVPCEISSNGDVSTIKAKTINGEIITYSIAAGKKALMRHFEFLFLTKKYFKKIK